MEGRIHPPSLRVWLGIAGPAGLSGVFHAITGANGRFKTGQALDVGAEGIDLYNTMLGAMGAKRRLGPTDREHRPVDAIRA